MYVCFGVFECVDFCFFVIFWFLGFFFHCLGEAQGKLCAKSKARPFEPTCPKDRARPWGFLDKSKKTQGKTIEIPFKKNTFFHDFSKSP